MCQSGDCWCRVYGLSLQSGVVPQVSKRRTCLETRHTCTHIMAVATIRASLVFNECLERMSII